jgi:RNase P subunit RPR2
MSVKQRSWRWRNRKPGCDQCHGHDMRRERIEVDWQQQQMKLVWRCQQCGNHVYIYAQRRESAAQAA